MLEALDLTVAESRCYELLVARPRLTVPEVAEAVDLAEKRLEKVLDDLQDKGLVSATPEEPPRLIPTPPEVAVEVLILRQRERFEQARIYASTLMDRYRDGEEPDALADYVELVRGRDAVLQRFTHLQRLARRELRLFLKEPLLATIAEHAKIDEGRLGGDVEVSEVLERCTLERTGDEYPSPTLASRHEHLRVVAQLPMSFAIADRSLGLVPLCGDRDGLDAAFLIHDCDLLGALLHYADMLWEAASPVSPGGPLPQADGAPLSQRDREILLLLQAGMTDYAIARRLEVSERTIGRRIRLLMDLCAAGTRFQLGCRAVERGWLDVGEQEVEGAGPGIDPPAITRIELPETEPASRAARRDGDPLASAAN